MARASSARTHHYYLCFLGIPSSYTNGSALMGEQQEKEYPGEMYDEEVYFYPVDEVIVEDCCPASVYKKIPCCEGTNEICTLISN